MATYTVQRGDNLNKIAKKFGVKSWRDLYNHPRNAGFRQKRPNPNIILPGDVMYVPGKTNGKQIIDLGETLIQGNAPVQDDKPVTDLTDAERKQLFDEAFKDVPSNVRRDWEKFLSSPGTLLKGVQLVELTGLIAPGAAWASGVLGGFYFYYSAIKSVAAALNTNERMYGFRGWAYTTTAWAFNEHKPTSSPEELEKYKKFSSDSTVERRELAWKTLSDKAWQNLERGYKKENVSKETWQMGLQFEGYKNKQCFGTLKEKLCHKLLKSLENEFDPGIQRELWQDGYKTLYPK